MSNTKVQPSRQTIDDTPIKVGTQVQVGQIDQSKEDDKDTPNEEEEHVMQALVNLPSVSTPTKIL